MESERRFRPVFFLGSGNHHRGLLDSRWVVWRELGTQSTQYLRDSVCAADGHENKDYRAGLRLTAEIPFSAFLTQELRSLES
jgi:hypothetical protein